MHQRAVKALVEVEDDEFPVGFDVVGDTYGYKTADFLHAPGSELLRQLAELPHQRLWPGAEVQEDVAVPNVGVNTLQRIILAAKTRHGDVQHAVLCECG